jgi:hypothetical protein
VDKRGVGDPREGRVKLRPRHPREDKGEALEGVGRVGHQPREEEEGVGDLVGDQDVHQPVEVLRQDRPLLRRVGGAPEPAGDAAVLAALPEPARRRVVQLPDRDIDAGFLTM